MFNRGCSFCLNAFSDPTEELTTQNDYSSFSVGDTAPHYRMSIDTGDNKPTRIVVTHWNESLQCNQDVCIYKMKYCPECGRELFENERFETNKT